MPRRISLIGPDAINAVMLDRDGAVPVHPALIIIVMTKP
jgi:hypothetical protein